MKILCEKCQGEYNIPDEKLPVDKQVGINCPKCKNKIIVKRQKEVFQQTPGESEFSFAFDEEDSTKPSIDFDEDESMYDSGEKPFDFVEEEYETALVCEADPAIREKIKIALDLMEYSITTTDSTRDALKNMRYHTYDLIVLNERFDTANPDLNGILIYLNRLVMAERRAITLFLLTDRYRTMDTMAAYNRSADAVVNIKDIDKIDTILQKGLNDSAIFYKIFKEYLTLAGKM
jgi:predicted Zn finger-like uncharacterized protein